MTYTRRVHNTTTFHNRRMVLTTQFLAFLAYSNKLSKMAAAPGSRSRGVGLVRVDPRQLLRLRWNGIGRPSLLPCDGVREGRALSSANQRGGGAPLLMTKNVHPTPAHVNSPPSNMKNHEPWKYGSHEKSSVDHVMNWNMHRPSIRSVFYDNSEPGVRGWST